MSFETLTKVDQLTDNCKVWLGSKPKNSGQLWSGDKMITHNDYEMNFHNRKLELDGGGVSYKILTETENWNIG